MLVGGYYTNKDAAELSAVDGMFIKIQIDSVGQMRTKISERQIFGSESIRLTCLIAELQAVITRKALKET